MLCVSLLIKTAELIVFYKDKHEKDEAIMEKHYGIRHVVSNADLPLKPLADQSSSGLLRHRSKAGACANDTVSEAGDPEGNHADLGKVVVGRDDDDDDDDDYYDHGHTARLVCLPFVALVSWVA